MQRALQSFLLAYATVTKHEGRFSTHWPKQTFTCSWNIKVLDKFWWNSTCYTTITTHYFHSLFKRLLSVSVKISKKVYLAKYLCNSEHSVIKLCKETEEHILLRTHWCKWKYNIKVIPKKVVRIWIRFIWLRECPVSGFCAHNNEMFIAKQSQLMHNIIAYLFNFCA
jgi:hypothetical protein